MKNYIKILPFRTITVLVIGLFITNISSAQCPVISNIEIPRGCENAPFESLLVESTADSVEIVAFTFNSGIDPYTSPGGTSISMHEMPANGTLTVQPYAHTLEAGFYLFFAIVHPIPVDPTCRPSAIQSVEILNFVNLETTDGSSCEQGRVNLDEHISGATSGNFVRYFNTLSDAENGVNNIAEFDYPSMPRYYYVTAQATDSPNIPDNCVSLDSFFIDILAKPTANAGSDQTICEGGSATLSVSGGSTFNWAPAANLTNATIANPETIIEQTTDFAVTITDANGCKDIDQVTINVTQLPVCLPISGSQN